MLVDFWDDGAEITTGWWLKLQASKLLAVHGDVMFWDCLQMQYKYFVKKYLKVKHENKIPPDLEAGGILWIERKYQDKVP